MQTQRNHGGINVGSGAVCVLCVLCVCDIDTLVGLHLM